jgi:hypothetical protein
MKTLMRGLYSAAILVFALALYIPVQAQEVIRDRFATVNGVKLHYLIAGCCLSGFTTGRKKSSGLPFSSC